jgi:DNA polymerase elongation subunit (family B)
MLMDSRSIYKDKMLSAKEAGDKQLTVEYNDKQLAFKIIANALYGALGQEHFRFYNPILGESITATGQEMLKYCAVHADYYMENKYKSDLDFKIDPKFQDKIKTVKNIVYGDTDSVFVYLTDYLKKKKLPCVKSPEVLNEVNKIQNFINGVIIPEVLKRHHVKMDRSMMYLKNEFLMNRYYALNAKKKYASRIISQEGKDINEVDVKGLEIKRSEIPLRSQIMLREILDVILDEKNTKVDIKNKVNKITKEARDDIYKLASEGNLDVAKVVSYSKKMEEYKVMPQHLLGMLTWNELCGKEEFKYGSKGKLFNVLGIDLNKAPKDVVDNYYNNYLKKFPDTPIESIVIPEGVNKMPDYFVIDMPKTVEYCCDDRINLIMSGLYVESDVDLLF